MVPELSDIIAVGSHVYGSYVRCDRLPRPGETVAGHGYHPCVLGDGGKGSNQALCAARLGAATTFIGVIGRNDPGDAAMKVLSEAGCDISHVAHHPTRPTGVSVAFLDAAGMSIIVTDPGANEGLTPELVASKEKEIARHRFCLTQFETPLKSALLAARLAARNGRRAIVTPGPILPLEKDDLAGIDILIPNETESLELVGEAGAAPRDLVRMLADRWGVRNVVMTQGSRGVTCLWDDAVVSVPAFKVEAHNTIGAGDGFAAALATGLCRNLDIEDALLFASAVSAIAVTHPGAPWESYPAASAVRAFLSAHGHERLNDRIAVSS